MSEFLGAQITQEDRLGRPGNDAHIVPQYDSLKARISSHTLELPRPDRAAQIAWDPVEVMRPGGAGYNLSRLYFPGVHEDLGIPQFPSVGWSKKWETVSLAIKPVDLQEGIPIVIIRPEQPSGVNFSLLTPDGTSSEIAAKDINSIYLQPDSDVHIQINDESLFIRGYLRKDPDHSGITVNYGGQFDHSLSKRGSNIYTMWGGNFVNINHREPHVVLGEGSNRVGISYLQSGVKLGSSAGRAETIFGNVA